MPRFTPRSTSPLNKCSNHSAMLPYSGLVTATLCSFSKVSFPVLPYVSFRWRTWEQLPGQTGGKHVSATDRDQEVTA